MEGECCVVEGVVPAGVFGRHCEVVLRFGRSRDREDGGPAESRIEVESRSAEIRRYIPLLLGSKSHCGVVGGHKVKGRVNRRVFRAFSKRSRCGQYLKSFLGHLKRLCSFGVYILFLRMGMKW